MERRSSAIMSMARFMLRNAFLSIDKGLTREQHVAQVASVYAVKAGGFYDKAAESRLTGKKVVL